MELCGLLHCCYKGIKSDDNLLMAGEDVEVVTEVVPSSMIMFQSGFSSTVTDLLIANHIYFIKSVELKGIFRMVKSFVIDLLLKRYMKVEVIYGVENECFIVRNEEGLIRVVMVGVRVLKVR